MADVTPYEGKAVLGPVYMEGGPQVGEVTCGGSPHLSLQRDRIEMRDYTDRRVTSPTRGRPPPCKQALSSILNAT